MLSKSGGVLLLKYPCLIPKNVCKTPIHIEINQEGISEDGEPLKAIEIDAMCNYQDTAKTVLTAEKKLVQLSGVALFCGDIAPELPTLSGGTVIVNGVKRTIFTGEKARNPDGSVNYCRLNLV